MAKTKISEFNANPALNTDIDSINISEGCAPSGINDAIRELMAQLKDWQSGTSNDPMVIGSSGSLTLNQGTANGVAYLNGSKVVTSGSALTFDGTTLTNANTIKVQTSAGTAPKFWIGQAATGAWSIGSPASVDALVFVNEQFGTESMRLTSTGLGIGTSSPSYKLDVSKSATGLLARFTGLNNAVAVYTDSTLGGFSDSTGQYGLFNVYSAGSATATTIWTANAERLRVDSSGNLGLGVTPSAWWSNTKALQVGAGMAIEARTSDATVFSIGANQYIGASANRIYLTSNAASLYEQNTGQHKWYIAPSGTAGNAISFTQAMSLNSSGALLVGVTATGLSNANYFYFDPAAGYGGNALIGHISGTASGVPYFAFAYNGSSIGSITQNGTTAVAYNTSSDYRLKNITGPVTTSGAYIDSLNPVEGTWKADGSTFVGLLAHEVQESSRTNVATGVKDGAEMQAMDYSSSELIANLIAEVKSLRQRVATLEAK